MFGNLFKSSSKNNYIKNIVWKTKLIKNAAILQQIMTNDKLILFYFSDATKSDLESILLEREIVYSTSMREDISLILLDANLLLSNIYTFSAFSILFIEHANSYQIEQKILSILSEKLYQSEFQFYISLEDQLFQTIDFSRIISLLDKLQLEDSESISHQLVDSSIERLQQNFDKA
jgi:hypothetical protein